MGLFKIKSIVEVEDLWPDLFKQRIKGRFLKFLMSTISLPYVFYARIIVLLSDKISSPTIEMADFFIKKYGTKRNYLGHKKKIFETPLIPPKQIKKNADLNELESIKCIKNLDNLKIFFAGSLMSVYDFKTVSEALLLLNKESINYTLLILGSGSYEDEIKSFFKGNKNVKFLGWMNYDDMNAVAKTCHISLSPYKSIPNYNLNIPNKILDYISMGLPIVTPVSGCTKSLIKNHNLGWSYEPENKISLANLLKEVILNHHTISAKAKNCIELYRIKYDFEIAYSQIASQITDLL